MKELLHSFYFEWSHTRVSSTDLKLEVILIEVRG